MHRTTISDHFSHQYACMHSHARWRQGQGQGSGQRSSYKCSIHDTQPRQTKKQGNIVCRDWHIKWHHTSAWAWRESSMMSIAGMICSHSSGKSLLSMETRQSWRFGRNQIAVRKLLCKSVYSYNTKTSISSIAKDVCKWDEIPYFCVDARTIIKRTDWRNARYISIRLLNVWRKIVRLRECMPW